jgi:hypothetical protein
MSVRPEIAAGWDVRRRVVQTADGVYRPQPLKLEFALASVVVLAFAAALAAGRIWWVLAALYIAPAVVVQAMRFAQLRKFGPLGPPLVSVAGGSLSIARTGADGELSVPLAGLQRVVVYGRDGRRKYRAIKAGGSHVEAVPLWRPDVERAVIQFLQQALPGRVVVEEPQTFFAEARGDEPATTA